MKAKIAGMLLAFAAMAPAHAENYVDLQQLAAESGLTVRKVQMIVGTRTAFAEYPYTYQRSLEKFQKALGPVRYERLMSGEPITLSNGYEVRGLRVASIDDAR